MIEAITNRILGLGQSIDLLTQKDWHNVPLAELLKQQTSSFGKAVKIDGPQVLLRAEAVQHLGMAIHELGTNAVKYGALSTKSGKVEITWNTLSDENGEHLVLEWKETGGPPATPPARAGFGTQILDRFLATSLNGKTALSYTKVGFLWSLTAPLQQLTDSTELHSDQK